MPARDSDHSIQFRLAYRALLLVSRGASERDAVQRAAALDPRSIGVKREALALVLGTVGEQDVIDILVRNVHPEEKMGMNARCLFRLTAYAMLRLGAKGQTRRIEHSLRTIAPIELLPRLEFFLGTLSAFDPTQQLHGLRDSERVALETHHPVWWVNYCFRAFGRTDAVELLSSRTRPRYLRVNPLKNRGRTTLPKELGVLAERLTKVLSTPGVYTVARSLSDFAGFFSSGSFQMQDLASFLAVKAGAPMPGENVLDLCAAPGAKTAAIAQLMKNRGTIVSVDYSRRRMNGWRREVQRLGVKIADPVISDASWLGLRDSFDLVIIDPPCTGTGVFDRNPRMKWHLSPKSVERYSTLQRSFLDSAASLVEKEGRILYCTCSLTLEENEDVVSRFLKSHLEFETRPILEQYGSPGLRGMSDCRRFFPHRDHAAGYFIARLQRTN
ncbi:RsmB/NOP family class I SAM-dependent RNA methyltransferase [Candidatus Bathyarchaeota archaeon]|nr:MAG: RsmB/NOP family class I SAM-dependent RNA methyltransferase [Candidatus Bathyarchaeota archaeon]